ncbi:MAG: SDR family oxidoreductase [Chitinophagaceae bacterium]
MTTKRNKVFENQTVIISGGLGDIGRATTLEFARRGAAIALCDLAPEAAAIDFVTSITHYNVACRYKQVDISNPDEVKAWVNETVEILGTPTIIIANAAMVTLVTLHDITPEQWSKELNVNLNGAFYLTRHATACLVARGLPGRVVFVGSWAGSSVHPHVPAYSVSKAAISMLNKCMALELAPYRILVNEIAPGYVDAGLSGRLWQANPGQREKAREKVPIKKIMTAKMVAQQILYLCHPRNEHMTGTTLLMDGGLSLL